MKKIVKNKKFLKLRTRHMVTKAFKPKMGKGTYNRKKEKNVEINYD